jgi:outer membrane receptor protein involved in Fe transport
MNRLYSRAGAFALSSALCLITVGRLAAQTTAAPEAAKPADEEAIILSPFVVEASEDADNYAAKNTLAGTRVRTELKDVGSAIQAITSKFLQDTGARNSQDLLVYTTSTEVGGSSGNFVGAGNGASIDTRSQRISPQTNTRVRGLASADNTRDFFLTDIPWDSYNVGRVDLQRGPNSILFGIGSPAGIVNSSLNAASFKDSNKVEFRLDDKGSQRYSADFNKVLMKNELAIRLSFLDDNTKYQQKPAYNHDKRIYGAVAYRPAFLKKNGLETNIKANYESGTVDANRPRIIPPIDAVSPWFDPANASLYKKTFNDTHIADTSPGDPEY